jgi:hypothetical protein
MLGVTSSGLPLGASGLLACTAENVGEPQHFEGAQRGIVHAALHDDADVAGIAIEELLEPMHAVPVCGSAFAINDLIRAL